MRNEKEVDKKAVHKQNAESSNQEKKGSKNRALVMETRNPKNRTLPHNTQKKLRRKHKTATLLHKNGRGRKKQGINIQEPVPEQQQHEERR